MITYTPEPKVQIVSLEEAVKLKQKEEYDDLTEKLKLKKREVKALEKEIQQFQARLIGWGDPFTTSDWLKWIYLQVKTGFFSS